MPKILRPSLNWLVILAPVALAFHYLPAWHNETAVFFFSGLAVIPVAGWMGTATEHLAERTGPGIGGLINASFGNAAELIIAVLALQKGLTGVVKASITGSIFGNILLVFGAAALAGGVKYREQRFNRTAAASATTSLLLAASGLLIPTLFHFSAATQPGGWSPALERHLSLAIAAVLFATYVCTLVFSLRTHRQLFSGDDQKHTPHPGKVTWTLTRSVLTLLGATALVAVLSEMLVGSVESARAKLGVSEVFIGVIVVAIIGNAAEHSTAVMVALRNKMDLSLGIAVGSSLQIALFVAPLLVFLSYPLGHPMDLEFTLSEVAAVMLAVLIVSEVSRDGETNWLEGAQLIAMYLILAILFYFLPESH